MKRSADTRRARIAVCAGAVILLLSKTSALRGQSATPAPAPAVAGVQEANDDLARGEYAGALTLLTALNAQTPKNPEILYDLGLTLEALHPEASSLPGAEADYRAAIAANPLFPLPRVALGLMLARGNHATEAREQLATAAQIADTSAALKARALRALARLDVQSHSPALASGELLQAIQLTAETPDDMLLSAEIAEVAQDLPAAEKAYQRYLSAAPKDTVATAALAHVLVAQHRPAEAEAMLRQALADHPGDPSMIAQLATTLLSSGDPANLGQATSLLERLHAAHPEDRNVSRLLARVYLENGHPDQADVMYATLLDGSGVSPDPMLLTDRAEALIRLHRPAEAERLLKQAVANPAAFPSKEEFAQAATRLAFAAEEIDDPRSALQALALRATVQPPSLAALFLEATARDSLHQSVQAAGLYQQFLAEAHGTLPEEEAKARERVAALKGRR